MMLATAKKIILTLTGVLIGLPVIAQEISIPAKQRVYIEARYAGADDIIVEEVQTGRRAALALRPVINRANRSNGYFLLDMGPNTTELQSFKIYDRKNTPLYGHLLEIKKSKFLALVIYNDAKERDNFAQRALSNPTLSPSLDIKAKAPTTNVVHGTVASKENLKQQKFEEARTNLELQVAEKRQKNIEAFEKLSDAETKDRRQQAKNISEKAFTAFKKNEFKEADALYLQSMELDPTVDQIYFQYAVTLYKQNKHNQSLVYLGAVQGGEVDSTEHSYYVALNHMKFREYEKAIKGFSEIRDENNSDLSPISAFFAASLQFKMQDYTSSKENFQYVLDNSKDPKIDRDAEAMIEKINQVEQYLESLKEIFRYSLTSGLIYDENILNTSANNSTTNAKGYRFLYGGNIYYHLFRKQTTQGALSLTYNDMYSVDSGFKANTTLQTVDPQMITIGLPIQKQFQWDKSSLGYVANPSYMLLNMDTDGTGRKQILSTFALANSLTTTPSAVRFGIYNFDLSKDQSYLTPTTSDDAQGGMRYKLGTSQIWLLGQSGQKTFTADLSYSLFQADGKNNSNKKIETNISWGFPGAWGMSASTKLGYATLQYPDSTTSRSDSTIVAGILGIKSFGALSLITNLDYNMNSSNIDNYKYNKFVATVILSYGGNVSRK